MNSVQTADGATRVIGYIRVSTSAQAATGYGLDAQRTAIEDGCRTRGWTLVETVVVPGVTGKIISPQLEHTMRRLDDGQADVLMVAKLDRLSRSLVSGAEIIERARRQGWSLCSLDMGIDMTTPVGDFIANVMLSFAQFERSMIALRTKEGLAAARAQGRGRGGRPTTDAPEVRLSIIAMRDQLGMTFADIAAALNDAGTPTLQGASAWRSSSVHSIYSRAACPARRT